MKHIAQPSFYVKCYLAASSPAWLSPPSHRLRHRGLKAEKIFPWGCMTKKNLSISSPPHLSMSLRTYSALGQKGLCHHSISTAQQECQVCSRCLLNTSWVDGISPEYIQGHILSPKHSQFLTHGWDFIVQFEQGGSERKTGLSLLMTRQRWWLIWQVFTFILSSISIFLWPFD